MAAQPDARKGYKNNCTFGKDKFLSFLKIIFLIFQGKFLWVDKREYEGDYVADQKEGFGTFRWPDGRLYTGK